MYQKLNLLDWALEVRAFGIREDCLAQVRDSGDELGPRRAMLKSRRHIGVIYSNSERVYMGISCSSKRSPRM